MPNNHSLKYSHSFKLLLGLILLAALALWPGQQLVEKYHLEQLNLKNQQTLDLFVANLESTLQKYEVLPPILSLLPRVTNALTQPHDAQALNSANLLLEEIQQQTGADVIYLLNNQGLTLAASNWQEPDSFIGNNFAFRPYFSDAIAGGHGEFFGLGNISMKRGYYFGSAVEVNGQILGVIAIKVDLDFTETLWGNTPEQLMVTDQNGVVIFTSRPEWRFQASRKLSAEEIAEISLHQPYTSANPAALNIKPAEWLSLQRQLPLIEWQVSILTPKRILNASVHTTLAIIGASLLALGLIVGMLLQRKHHYLASLRLAAQAKTELEANVKNRTQELQNLNSRLKDEVLEREAAQQKLVSTQDELVQASKLSALGIMSASISHELNQPLAAIRSYTDNAKIFLAQQREAEVQNNLNFIASLTERMASIIEHLRAFARRDNRASEHVSLQAAVEDTLHLIASQQEKLGVTLIKELPETTLWVAAGETRLRQILTNLLNNALDALSEIPTPREIRLSTQVSTKWVILHIQDNGSGFSESALQQACEPFFTTKTSAKGLGLGLAISHSLTKALEGHLEISNQPTGGAWVKLYLKPLDNPA